MSRNEQNRGRLRYKSLSFFISIVMVLTMIPVTAFADSNDSWVGSESFDYDAVNAGSAAQGWTWSHLAGETPTLTLSGVDASKTNDHGINIAGDATIILEGANKVTLAEANAVGKNALNCTGELTIEGSGTLEASTAATGQNITGSFVQNAAISANFININSGYIKASSTGNTYSHGIKTTSSSSIRKALIVNGGYVEATASGDGSENCGIKVAGYKQTGGYVKASATGGANGSSGLADTSVVVSDGYLEASGVSRGIYCSTIENGGGVIKATATGSQYAYGIANGGTGTFSGGVTIAKTKGTTNSQAINGNVTGGEEYWAATDGIISGDGTALPSTEAKISGNELVIAYTASSSTKTATSEMTLSGTYINTASTTALDTSYKVTAVSGSYLGSRSSSSPILKSTAEDGVVVSGTLVCENLRADGSYSASSLDAKKIVTGKTGTLYSNHHGSYWGGKGILAPTITNNGGNLIGRGGGRGLQCTTGVGSYSGKLTVTGGYTCGIENTTPEAENTTSSGINVEALEQSGGYITTLGGSQGLEIITQGTGPSSFTGTAALTAIGNGNAYKGIKLNAAVTGTDTTSPKAPAATTYEPGTQLGGKYKVDGNNAKTIFISALRPSATVGTVAITGNKDRAITSTDVTLTLANEKFNAIAADTDVKGWFKNIPEGLTAKVKTAVAADATTATITISGTPTATSTDAMNITIPAEKLKSNVELTVTSNANAKWNISPAPSATVGTVTVTGNKDRAIDSTDVTLTLANEKFNAIEADTDVKGWFTNIPAGLTAKVKTAVTADDETATITISGTPTETSTVAMNIIIPAAKLKSDVNLTVTPNTAAKWNISPAPIYAVKVNGGSGSGSYGEGSSVTITANKPANGMTFAGWTVNSGDVTLANAKASTTTFTMPAKAVTVTAKYKQTISPGTIITQGKVRYEVTNNNGVTVKGFAKGKFIKKPVFKDSMVYKNITFKIVGVASKAFKGKKITAITLGNNIKTIGSSAFYSCKSLKTVKIGKRITTIGKSVFAKDTKLRTLTIKSTALKKVGSNTLLKCKNLKIKVPAKCVKKYTKLFKNKGANFKKQNIKVVKL